MKNLRTEPEKDVQCSVARNAMADPDCEYCAGTGERLWHSSDCRSEFCALALGYDDCIGRVETCPCVAGEGECS
jgi:hypothetical protein